MSYRYEITWVSRPTYSSHLWKQVSEKVPGFFGKDPLLLVYGNGVERMMGEKKYKIPVLGSPIPHSVRSVERSAYMCLVNGGSTVLVGVGRLPPQLSISCMPPLHAPSRILSLEFMVPS